jgi:hypothetical protein
MPQVEFEPTISVLERAKTVRALDRAATAIGCYKIQAKYHIGHNPLSGFATKASISEIGSHFIFERNGEPNVTRLFG